MSNNSLIDPLDEEKLCKVLKTFIEEFGVTHVSVRVPDSWRGLSSYGDSLGPVKLIFDPAVQTVAIIVNYDGSQIVYEAKVNAC